MSDELDIDDDGAATSDRKPRPNSRKKSGGGGDAHGVARDQLRSFVERIEHMEAEKKTITDDIKDIYGEAKGVGFDTKVLRAVVARRKRDREEVMEFEAVLDTYLAALGEKVLDSIGDED